MKKTTVKTLKEDLRALGAHVTGNKSVLETRLNNWRVHKLDRTLLDINVVPAPDESPFPAVDVQPLEKLVSSTLEFLTPPLIAVYFAERSASKGDASGRRLFMCEFLKNISFSRTLDNIYFFAKCSAQTKKSVDYATKVHLNIRERMIMKSECECPAGKGFSAACKHIGALLYGLEYYAVTGNVKQNKTCTSMPQQWHIPREQGRGLERVTVDQMLGISSPQIEPRMDVTNFYLNAFSKGEVESSMLTTRRCNVPAYLNDHQYSKDSLETIILNRMNAVSTGGIRKIEKKTRKNMKMWHETRKTRITASIAHYVVRTCRSKKFVTSFLKTHILNIPLRTKAIKWGISQEPIALKEYCKVMGEKFEKCGIFIDKNCNYISATPDAINESKSLIVEIKCPFSAKDDEPTTVDYLKTGRLTTSHQYYTQIQLQMHITNIQRCDFVVWTPKGIYIENIQYDHEMVSKYLKDIEFYYKNVFSKYYFECQYQ